MYCCVRSAISFRQVTGRSSKIGTMSPYNGFLPSQFRQKSVRFLVPSFFISLRTECQGPSWSQRKSEWHTQTHAHGKRTIKLLCKTKCICFHGISYWCVMTLANQFVFVFTNLSVRCLSHAVLLPLCASEKNNQYESFSMWFSWEKVIYVMCYTVSLFKQKK